MKCIKCTKKSEIKLGHIGDTCKSCFLKIAEKRVRKQLRINSQIKKNDKILFINNGSKEFYVGEYLFKKIIKGLPVKITTKKSSKLNISAKKHSKIIIPWSLDDEAEQFLNFVFNKKKQSRFSKKTIKLLKCLSEEEIEMFAKIKKFKYKKPKTKQKPKIRQMLDLLEQRYPGYKFSLLNSIKSLSS